MMSLQEIRSRCSASLRISSYLMMVENANFKKRPLIMVKTHDWKLIKTKPKRKKECSMIFSKKENISRIVRMMKMTMKRPNKQTFWRKLNKCIKSKQLLSKPKKKIYPLQSSISGQERQYIKKISTFWISWNRHKYINCKAHLKMRGGVCRGKIEKNKRRVNMARTAAPIDLNLKQLYVMSQRKCLKSTQRTTKTQRNVLGR